MKNCNLVLKCLMIVLLVTVTYSSDLKSPKTNLDFIKLTLINTIHNSVSIQGLSQWYLYVSDSKAYTKYQSNSIELQKQSDLYYENYISEVKEIQSNLFQNTFTFDKLVELGEYDKQLKGFPISGLINQGAYFLIDSLVEKQFDSVSRHYLTNTSMYKTTLFQLPSSKTQPFINSRIDSSGEFQREIFVRYYLKVKDVRLNTIDKSFLNSIHNLNIELDIYSEIEKIEFLDLDKTPL